MSERTNNKLSPSLNFRWYRPKGCSDNEIKLQQRWYDPEEKRDAVPIWKDVPIVLED